MLSKNLTALMSAQVTEEYGSAYLYLAMSAYADRLGFPGFANWFHVQAQEELAHGTHLFEHILERGEKPELGALAAPKSDFTSLLDAFEQTLKHEQYITGRINKLASAALQEQDHASYQFLQWYVTEQIEEEANAELLLQKVRHIGDNAGLLYALDQQLATRVFVNPFPAKA